VITARVVFSPLDERLKLGTHHWTPETIERALRQAVEIPSHRRAAQNYEALTGLGLSKSSLERLTGEWGGRLVAQQAAEAEATVKLPERGEVIVPRAVAEPDSDTMAVSLDGTTINVVGEGWREVRVATISAVEEVVELERDEEQRVRLTRHSYRAGLWEVPECARQQWAEGCRRGLERVKRLAAIGDGAHWIWLIIAMCYAPCVEIIDWWHAVEKIWQAGNSLFGQGGPATAVWVEQQKGRLWSGDLRAVLHALRAVCPRGQPLNEAVWALISYLLHNRRRMDYAAYRAEGYPVGSGSVESACKVVVHERLRQAGMRWGRPGAQAMLALRSILLSDRWDQVVPSLSPTPKLA
jgi:hypothetical protein